MCDGLPVFLNSQITFRNSRTDSLHRCMWEGGKEIPSHIKEKLSEHELVYYSDYQQAITEYCKDFGESSELNLDITVDMTPPRNLFI